jgi:hypothetical protein
MMRFTASKSYDLPAHHNLLHRAELAVRLALVPPTQTVFADFGQLGFDQRAGVVMRLGNVRA